MAGKTTGINPNTTKRDSTSHHNPQTCPGCGRQEKKTLNQRVHSCPDSEPLAPTEAVNPRTPGGLLAAGDHASALVMLNRYLTAEA